MSMPPEPSPANRPRFSIVSAVYNVERYLDDFFGSIERQSIGIDALQLVLVDDGSTDSSLERLHEFASRHPGLVTVLHKDNGGQASARNVGLEHATGEWVTFIDPDDWIADDYFERVADVARSRSSINMLATNRLMAHEEADGTFVLKKHALASMFASGDQVVDLSVDPTMFHGSAPSAFLRLDSIRDRNLRFNPVLRTNFEDGDFCVRYLDATPDPLVGFVASAVYYYRRRSDGTSTLQQNAADPCRYVDVPRIGLLGVLQDSAERYGRPSAWLQNMIIYELSWYFGGEEGTIIRSPNSPDDRAYFLESLRRIFAHIDDDTILTFRRRHLRPIWRMVMLHGFRDERWVQRYALISELDTRRNLIKLTYVYQHASGTPHELITQGGEQVTPVFSKRRAVIYFGAQLLTERIAWVSVGGPIRLFVDNNELVLQREDENAKRLYLTTQEIETLFGTAKRGRLPEPAPTPPPPWHQKAQVLVRKPLRPVTRRVADAKPYKFAKELATASQRKREYMIRRRAALQRLRSETERARFSNVVLFMDRVLDANDSGEHLFAYVRSEYPELNSYFVISRDSPEWDRLHAAFGDRLIAYHSTEWYMAWTGCVLLASSHADQPILAPNELKSIPKQKWQFFFLQHGVTKDDLSNWLNPKPIAAIVTSTPDEHESMVGDNTAYVFTNREARMTGLPRFDRLQAARDRIGDADRRLVIVAPTWRQWLVKPVSDATSDREYSDEFSQSDFARQWSELVQQVYESPSVQSGAVELAYLPHPNLIGAVDLLDWPSAPRQLSFEDDSLYDNIARCHLLITDYSSMAFNAAYLERQVLYFQFDSDRMLGGEHVGRQGYFTYETHGFGPVVETPGEVVQFLEASVARGGVPDGEYLERIIKTFPNRDGLCSQRAADVLFELLK